VARETVARETKSREARPKDAAPLHLREYLPEDLKELSEIDQQCFPPGIAYDRRELAAYIQRPDTLTLIAEATSSRAKRGETIAPVGPSVIAGFIVARKLKGEIGHVITIDVLPQARRSGLGSQLMAEAERRLQTAGCHAMFLEVAVNNLAAIQFYKRRGYFVLKTIPRYYQGELDALLMMKRLA
jgi:[ribosomal protein S18]-alanine N-acetyltransferase